MCYLEQKKTSSVVNTGGSLSKATKKDKAIGRSGSYSLKQKKNSEMKTIEDQTAPHSFKRCVSEPQDGQSNNINQLPLMQLSQGESIELPKNSTSKSDSDVNQGTYLAKSKINGKISEKEFLPPPMNGLTSSLQKRAPPPIPPRVSSLKPKADTPQSPIINLTKQEIKEATIAVTPCIPGVSSTPLHSGKSCNPFFMMKFILLVILTFAILTRNMNDNFLEDWEEGIMMETKSINSPCIGVRQKLNFMDTSYDHDSSKNKEDEQSQPDDSDYENDGEFSNAHENHQNNSIGTHFKFKIKGRVENLKVNYDYSRKYLYSLS